MSKIACHTCGVPLPSQTRFCPSCGTALQSTLPVSQPASPPLPKPAAQPARRMRPRGCLIALLVFVLSGTLLIMLLVSATTVNIHDDAHILDTWSIQTAEQDLANFRIDVYTVSNFPSNDPNALLHDANTHQQDQDTVIEIDPLHRQVAVDDPSSDSLSNDAYKAFVKQFASTHDYTAATVAAINTLKASSIPSSPAPSWLLPIRYLGISFRLLVAPVSADFLGVIALLALLLSIGSMFPHQPRRRASSSGGGGSWNDGDYSSGGSDSGSGGSDSGGGDHGSAGHF